MSVSCHCNVSFTCVNLFAFLYVDYDLDKDFMKQFKLNAEKATGMVKYIRKVAEDVKKELNGGKS
jgi:hypothetical protein